MRTRSFLYVPGDRTDRLAKAHTWGADAIVADLEDSVAPSDKDMALANVEDWLKEMRPEGDAPLWVRLNSDRRGLNEFEMLVHHPNLKGVLVPKVESPQRLTELHQVCVRRASNTLLAPMIESAVGLERILELVTAPGVHQLHIGEYDLAADLGLTPGDAESEWIYARSRVVVASRYGALTPPAAPVSARFDDPHWFAKSTKALARMGFLGRDCIHPTQIGVANDVFTVSAEEVMRARELLDLSQGRPGSFRGPDGSMIDEAVLRWARSVLAQQ